MPLIVGLIQERCASGKTELLRWYFRYSFVGIVVDFLRGQRPASPPCRPVQALQHRHSLALAQVLTKANKRRMDELRRQQNKAKRMGAGADADAPKKFVIEV